MSIASIGNGASSIQLLEAVISKNRSSNDRNIIANAIPVDRNEASQTVLTLQNENAKPMPISKTQAERLHNLLTRADSDGDGFVTPEELKKLIEQLKSELERMKKMESDMKIIRAIQAYKGMSEESSGTGSISNDIKMLEELQK